MAVRLWLLTALLAVGSGNALLAEQQADAGGEAVAPAAVVTTVVLEPAKIAQQVTGVANILSPDALIQLDADIRAAEIAASFSERELARYKSTKSLSLHVIEGAQRQAETAATQRNLLELRLKNSWGDTSPFIKAADRKKLIDKLSTGKMVLARLDFSEVRGERLQNFRVMPLHAGALTAIETLWPAPSGNSAMPGISYFGLIASGPGLRHLDRARVIADRGPAQPGVVIPQSALIVFAGETWCYVETSPQKFERRKVPLTSPVADGYLVDSGFAAGTKVVVRGASTLLSREAGPGEDDEDDDGPETRPSKPGPKSGEPLAETPKGKGGDDDDEPASGKARPATAAAPMTGSTSPASAQ